ncbi:hypothetical protein KO506_11220 [Polaribacter vadi]|uniref:hypothetical protein n=1 Tax=Polaribacter TaxID=52959 RepID=UPI001C0908B2|nr:MULTISPECIES: hypothetical protein [Polaribacter]MBU3011976.1 hypothetical protein [Polaribacter vadi]MDO6741791.1 hypothetical protein [Polaribacter sp. 1_MG-2023]
MAKTPEQNNETAPNQQVDTRIAAVRDLIFGENIQRYDSEFADVYEKIEALKKQSNNSLADAVTNLENKLSDLESLVDHKFQDLNDDLDKKLADLDDEKTDRRKLGKALEKIAQMLQE